MIETQPARWPGQREDIEADLDALGLSWRFNPDGLIGEIDRDRSLANQARLGSPIVEERVEAYAIAIRQGAKMPAIVVDRLGRKRKAIVMDGNHRVLASQRAGYDIFARYEVVDGDPAAVNLYTFQANVTHGLPNSLEERVEHAIWLVDSGIEQRRALAQLQVPAGEFKKAWNRHLADRRADEVGVTRTQWEQLGAAVRLRLANLATDEAFAGAVELAYKASLSSAEVDGLVSALNSTRSTAKQQQILTTQQQVYAERIAAGGGGALARGAASRRPMTAKQRWNVTLGSIVALPDPATVASQLSGAERDDYRTRCRAAARKLTALARSL